MPVDSKGNFKVGYKTTEWLFSIGLYNIKDVSNVGIFPVCKLLRSKGYPVSVNLAYGLQAEIMKLSINKLPSEIKEDIKRKYKTEMAQQGDAPETSAIKNPTPCSVASLLPPRLGVFNSTGPGDL